MQTNIVITAIANLKTPPHLSKHIKLYIVLLDKLLDLFSRPWLLAAKLVAGEAQDSKLRRVFAVKLHQFGVVHSSQASLAGHIHNHCNSPSETDWVFRS